jgi:hypothetical protein
MARSRCRVASHQSTAQGFDGEVALQAVTRGPANDAAGEEVQHDGEGEPALCRPDVGDVRPHFLSGPSAVKSCATRFGATRFGATRFGATGQACSLSVVRLKRRLGRAINWFSRIRRAVRCRPISWPSSTRSEVACAGSRRCRSTARRPCGTSHCPPLVRGQWRVPDRPCPAAGGDRQAVPATRRSRSG